MKGQLDGQTDPLREMAGRIKNIFIAISVVPGGRNVNVSPFRSPYIYKLGEGSSFRGGKTEMQLHPGREKGNSVLTGDEQRKSSYIRGG